MREVGSSSHTILIKTIRSRFCGGVDFLEQAGGALWRNDERQEGEGGGGGLHAEAQVQPRLVLHCNP